MWHPLLEALEYLVAYYARQIPLLSRKTHIGEGLAEGRPQAFRDGLYPDESGQATPEYALVILAAVALAATLIVWAKRSGAIADLFEFVIGKVKDAAGG
jgi:hypothetical protein